MARIKALYNFFIKFLRWKESVFWKSFGVKNFFEILEFWKNFESTSGLSKNPHFY